MLTTRQSAPVFSLALLCASCSGATVQEPVLGDPYVRGAVEEFTHHATASSLRVSGGPGSQEMCGIVATVDAGTRYLRRDLTGAVQTGARGEITVGDTVEVHVTGDVQESCPVQGYGAAVVLVHDLGS